MKKILIVILLNLAMAGSVLGQIDTLALVEITSIQTSSEIRELYIEDLNGDSLKEIIICTDGFVQVYNSQTYQAEWTSPALIMPTSPVFCDVNRDNLIDISVNDSTNVYLFDPHSNSTIWVSPTLDSTYQCFTVGNRNNNNFVDVAIATKEPFTRSQVEGNMDTIWINIYNGPSYQFSNELIILMRNESIGALDYSYYRSEIPTQLLIHDLTSGNELVPNLLVISKVEVEIWFQGYPRGGGQSGELLVYNGADLNLNYSDSLGECIYWRVQQENNNTYLYGIRSNWGSSFDFGNYIDHIFSDSISHVANLLGGWNGFVVNDLNPSYPGNEICLNWFDDLYQFSEAGSDTIWIEESINGIVVHKLGNNTIFDSPQIICEDYDPYPELKYHFFNGTDGMQSGILINPGYEILKTADLNNDGNDIIFSIEDSTLYIFDLDYTTGIKDNLAIPNQPELSQNHPNPFNAATTVKYDLPKACDVTIDIYDILGRRAATLVRERQQAGHHSVVWNADRFSSGMYFYRIQAGDFAETKKMLLLK